MLGVHSLIGLGEGLITALTVGAVVSVRPDLVYGAQDLVPGLTLRVDAAVERS
jgi:cobalt/nickel transport system permease protein